MANDRVGTWLPVTPLGADGAPPRVPATVSFDPPPAQSPVLGELHETDGVTVREVTFVYQDAAERDVMIHLNGLTDNHRENIEPALLQRIPTTSWYALTYLLPDDGTWSYRIVARDHIPPTVGAERSEWMRIHADGRPDPYNPERLRHPHGEESSVLRMPASPLRREWPGSAELAPREVSAQTWLSLDLPELADAPGPAAAHHVSSGSDTAPLLVLFDAEQLVTMPIAEALQRYEHPVDLLLIDSGTSDQRGQVLPHPERVTERVRLAVQAVSAQTGRIWSPHEIIVSGVSYGGLAAANIVVHHPEVADRAIVQSGSFWFDPSLLGAPGRDMTEPGALTRCLTDGPARPGRRLVLTVGTDEGTMAQQTGMFAAAAEAACIDVSLRQYRGGHDWAWWSHALFDGLNELLN